MIPVLLAIATFIELAGSFCLVAGYHIRIAAFVMFLYTTVVTVLFHNYWAASAAMAGIQETHFRKNLAIIGGLLMPAYGGGGKCAIREANGRPETVCRKRYSGSPLSLGGTSSRPLVFLAIR